MITFILTYVERPFVDSTNSITLTAKDKDDAEIKAFEFMEEYFKEGRILNLKLLS